MQIPYYFELVFQLVFILLQIYIISFMFVKFRDVYDLNMKFRKA